MKTPLSPRLRACCDFVRTGDVVADIGCDHGYLGIHLLKSGIADHVIASDIHVLPLSAARRNAVKYGTADKMDFIVSDGVLNIPRDFTVLVCAGMGADTIISILEQGEWLKSSRYRLILQCQSRTHILRSYLSRNGWGLRDEIPVRDGKFVYTVMEVIYNPCVPFTPGECYISPALKKHRGDLLNDYRARIINGLRLSVEENGDCADPEKVLAYRELCQEDTE